MPKRHLLATLLLSACLSLAAPVQLTPVGTKDDFALLGKTPITYVYDPVQRTLTIPQGALVANVTLPEGMRAEQSDTALILRLSDDYQVSLSSDGYRLQLTRGKSSTATQTAVQTTTTPPGAAQPESESTISSAPLPNSVPLEAAVFPLAYASPSQVAQLLSDLYGTLRVRVDDRRHALVALVTPADRALIAAFVQQLDTPSPQVSFEAEVLEVNKNLTSSLGIDYDRLFTFKLTEATAGAGLLKLGEVVRNPLSLTVGINLLQNSGAARVLARPRITTLDGVEARINATQTYPLVVSGGTNTTPIVQNITTGVSLRLLPRVAPNGDIEVQINITVSTPTGVTSAGAPEYSSREATTIVRVKNGQPIAIGGLIEDRRIEGVAKVPLLGDLPLIGALFRTTTTDQRNTDLVIMITPRLIPAGPKAP